MSRTTVALVPLRALGAGKSRLAETTTGHLGLTGSERAALAGAMLADVARALLAAPVDRVVVVAGGTEAAAAATALGLEVVLEGLRTVGLDAALAAAAGGLTDRDLLVVMADLPRLTPDDVEAVLRPDAQVVVAPTEDGGTGALLRRPGSVMATGYGPGSGARHLERAREAGLDAARVDRPGLAHDVDTWPDLAKLLDAPVGRATAAFVSSVAPRLREAG